MLAGRTDGGPRREDSSDKPADSGGRLIAVKQQRRAPLDSVYGILRVAGTTDELITELRGPAELP